MSGAELRELAGMLPRPAGNNGNLPTFIEFLPHRGYVANTQKYVMGPTALAALAPQFQQIWWISAPALKSVRALQHFERRSDTDADLVSYAATCGDHLRRIDAAHQVAQPQAGESTIGGSGTFLRQAHRTDCCDRQLDGISRQRCEIFAWRW